MNAMLMALVLSLGQVEAPPTPSDAVGWAIAHQITLPLEDRPFYRYIWIPPWLTDEEHTELHIGAALSYMINEIVSQEGVLILPEKLANGWMLTIDLRRYASTNEGLQTLVDVWDRGGIDEPFFHITKENLRSIPGSTKQIKVRDSSIIAVYAPHIEASHAELLATSNLSPMSVVRADWLVERVMHIKYYEFMQFVKKDGSLLDQFEVYKTLGVDEELAKRVNGDQRVAIFISDISGKPRRIDRIQGAGGRYNTGAVFQTWDILDESVTTGKNPLYNLLAFNPDGGEAIFERQNGLHGYIIYDDGTTRNLVREAPANLVSDHMIPAPYTRRLVPGISCVRCHAPHKGIRGANNDVTALLATGTDIIFDFSGSGFTNEQAINRLAGLYAGDFTRRVRIAQEDYELAVRRATWMPNQTEGMGVEESGLLLAKIYNDYVYKPVTAKQACLELGYIPGPNPTADLARILDTNQPGTARNVVIAGLLANLRIRRGDWNQVYSAARQVAAQTQGK